MASILIPYSDAHSINIQLHRDHVALSILLPFPPMYARCMFVRVRSAEGNGLLVEDSAKREREREREYVYQPGTVYKVDRGIIMFARLSNVLAFQIDSSGH